METKKELAYKVDYSQFKLPYYKCNAEEKLIRRNFAMRLKIIEEERIKNGQTKKFSDRDIYKNIANVPRTSFYNWYRQEKENNGSGMSGYKRGPKQRGSKYLSDDIIEKLKKDITTKYPSDFGISRCLWDRKSVGEYLQILFNVKYSYNTISKILHSLGFVFRRPAKFSIKRDQEAIDTFKTDIYPQIIKEVEEDNGILLFLDETAVQQNSNTCRGFSPVGIAPHLAHHTETSAHRAGSLFICISLDGFMYHHFEEKSCKATDFKWFLEQLSKKLRSKKIHIVLDNAKIHKAKLINEFLKDSTNIRLHFLPPYAPDINPVELFNNALKSNIRYEKAMNSEELIEFVQNYMNEKEKDNESVKQFFNGKEVQYAKSA